MIRAERCDETFANRCKLLDYNLKHIIRRQKESDSDL